MRFSVVVNVQLRPGIADPEGATIERALPTLGFTGASEVRVGKSIRFTLEADDADAAERLAGEMSEQILTNPVIEDATVEVT